MEYIYGVSTDKEPENIRYIGKATNIEDRLKRHISKYGLKPDTYKNRRIKKEILNGNNIFITELYRIKPDETWQDIEKEWIKKYKDLGYNLTNSTDGGDGGFNECSTKKNIETRIKNNLERKKEKIELYKIKKIEDGWIGERICPCCKLTIIHKSIKGLNEIIYLVDKLINKKCLRCKSFDRKLTQEEKDKISKSKQNLSRETRDKLSKINKGKVISEEVREKIRKTLTGHKQSEATKIKRANKHKIKIICENNNVEYESIKAACAELNCSSASVIKVLNGKIDNTKGLKFKYKNI